VTDQERKREPTEKTPKGFEVRVPKRGEFSGNLKKIAGKPDKGASSTRSAKK
jgi:hypothetical protein